MLLAGTINMMRHLQSQGVTFQRENPDVAKSAWRSYFAGAKIAKSLYLGELIWTTAEILGEIG